MRTPKPALITGVVIASFGIIAVVAATHARAVAFAGAAVGAPPTSSSPIAVTHDDATVWVVNPENNSVSALQVKNDVFSKVRQIPVAQEPRCVAITPDDKKVYVTCMAAGTVAVIAAAGRSSRSGRVLKEIPVGAEPFGCVVTPDGKRLYVANFSSDSVSVIDTRTDRVAETIPVGPKPRGIAITGGDEGTARLFVTHFLAQLNGGKPVDEQEGGDFGKHGLVTVLDDSPDHHLRTVFLEPLLDTGFDSNDSTLHRIPPTNLPTFTFATGAFPNLLQGIAIEGNRVYLPNTGASPDGPFRFNVNVQGLLSSIDLTRETDTNETLNMNRGVQFEPIGVKLFNTNPIAIAFKRGADEGFVVLAATNRLVRVQLDADGTPTINAPTMAGDAGGIVRIEVGKNPQGIVLNSTDTRAYVMNRISRDVSVVDITRPPANYHEIARLPVAPLPAPGALATVVLRGHELFNTSIGPAGTQTDSLPPAGRMSDLGWGSCYSCHPDGRTDGVTWMFPDGPRQSISLESTAEHPQPHGARVNANGAPKLPAFKQRVLNWSAVRDEIQDIELNIRGVSGGEGLITDGQNVVNLQPTANTGRSADLDAIAAYISFGIRAPVSPLRRRPGTPVDPEILAGRVLFTTANCQSCHGGPNWTRSRVDFTPPPVSPPEVIAGGQLVRFLNPVGTFDATAFNEVKANTAVVTGANGALGFNIPSLVSVFASAPYFHSGAAPTLDDVLMNVTHRSAGSGGADTLSNAADRATLVKFLKSIDTATTPFR